MHDRQIWVALDHSRTRESHDLPHLLARFGPIAVNGTVGARWLFGTVWAEIEPPIGVIRQLAAFAAQIVSAVVMLTIERHHGPHGDAFAPQAAMFTCHRIQCCRSVAESD
jgi:hypothetical protein